ncbi:MAG: hypothetical protein ABI325_10825 [Ginsengibacter sp.]
MERHFKTKLFDRKQI